jgi:hypothetical protein
MRRGEQENRKGKIMKKYEAVARLVRIIEATRSSLSYRQEDLKKAEAELTATPDSESIAKRVMYAKQDVASCEADIEALEIAAAAMTI